MLWAISGEAELGSARKGEGASPYAVRARGENVPRSELPSMTAIRHLRPVVR
jgi:hypothetical protein